MSEHMYDEGYTDIINIDISQSCIENMKSRNEQKRPQMKWDVMDVCDMSQFEDETFDIVIDKSTIDSILCTRQGNLNVAIMLKECQRVLKTGGSYVAIS